MTITHTEPELKAGDSALLNGAAAGTFAGTSDARLPIARGSTTLISGTKAVTISDLTTSAICIVTVKTTGGTLGASYKAVPTTNTLTITSVVAAGTTQTLDTSTLFYVVWAS